jgi:RNA polymerase sporulation-specific sigma factor
MDYTKLNDNELVYLCCDSNEDAINLMITKYKPHILKILKELLKEYNIIGYEVSDLYQEGLIGLLYAIHSYKENEKTTFYTYSTKCIKNNIMNFIRRSFRKKNRILNNSYSLDKLFEESNETYYNLLKDNSFEPSNILIGHENETDIIRKLKARLSDTENVVFDLRMNGLKNSEIAELLGKEKKHIENTLNRINRKYKELFINK